MKINKNILILLYILLFINCIISIMYYNHNNIKTLKETNTSYNCNNSLFDDNYNTTDTIYYNDSTDVYAGQVWVYPMNKNNPFEEINYYEMHIIDVKDNYVKYKHNGRIKSGRTEYVLYNSYRIK